MAVCRFTIVRLDFLHTFQSLLYLFGYATLHMIDMPESLVEFTARQQQCGNAQRHHPEECGGQSPVVIEHSDGNNDDTRHGGKKLRDSVREYLFEHGAVFHYGGGEVRQVALAEESQRQTAQFLCHADARSEEHTSELQSRQYLVCRLLL